MNNLRNYYNSYKTPFILGLGFILGIAISSIADSKKEDKPSPVVSVATPTVKLPESKVSKTDSDGLTAEMRYNMEVCRKAGLLYLSELSVLGFKAECLTKVEYDRRLEAIDRYIANSELKDLK